MAVVAAVRPGRDPGVVRVRGLRDQMEIGAFVKVGCDTAGASCVVYFSRGERAWLGRNEPFSLKVSDSGDRLIQIS